MKVPTCYDLQSSAVLERSIAGEFRPMGDFLHEFMFLKVVNVPDRCGLAKHLSDF